MQQLQAKQAVSLVRYTAEILPADKAFFLAGERCRHAGLESMAFVFYNRFLDLAEMIDDGEMGQLDNTDFAGTDVPYDIVLPDAHHADEERRDEVREWVLAKSMEGDAGDGLDLDARGVFVGSLYDEKTGNTARPCVVTGYPVLENSVEMASNHAANRPDWNAFVMCAKSSHDEKLQDILRFMAGWCGSQENPAFQFH